AEAAAAAAGQAASAVALRSALVAAAVELDAFDRVAEAAGMAVRDTMERRVASVAEARARVRAAVAAGWPVARPGAQGTTEERR
ncbi:MAG TPA: hypothetical protein VFZ65_03000, partial [Planctomycetota bacterium]|nr:hypothetical protein [Planctomycetota bacterium]